MSRVKTRQPAPAAVPARPRRRDGSRSRPAAQFAEHGYERATFRAHRRGAGVDPALVVHFFGSKEEPLPRGDAAAAVRSPTRLSRSPSGPREGVGRRLAELIVAALESPATRPIVARAHPVGLVASGGGRARARDRDPRPRSALVRALDDDGPRRGRCSIGAQVVGIALARYVVRVEPLASMPAAERRRARRPDVPALPHRAAHHLTGLRGGATRRRARPTAARRRSWKAASLRASPPSRTAPPSERAAPGARHARCGTRSACPCSSSPRRACPRAPRHASRGS